jgi:hypothetical protein
MFGERWPEIARGRALALNSGNRSRSSPPQECRSDENVDHVAAGWRLQSPAGRLGSVSRRPDISVNPARTRETTACTSDDDIFAPAPVKDLSRASTDTRIMCQSSQPQQTAGHLVVLTTPRFTASFCGLADLPLDIYVSSSVQGRQS